ncbi:helix-turn-helix domain-containing protein [Gordonia sp. CPCC 206044]|uniref:TetR/AcrR family transcriptional regulator n=1 Tax=Gordonia sp. CPCC 206044 TaxID=3140793 RepID=UPI003AF3F309
MTTSREKILAAAAEMIEEDVAASLSVRAVATRAGVSVGSLRFHFPTQRELQDAVLARVYESIVPDDPVHDRRRPARDRLVDCLRQILTPAGVGADARRTWKMIYEKFIEPEPTADAQKTYLGYERESMRRVQYWLSVLADEGVAIVHDRTTSARFLLTVLNGLSVERAMPTGESRLKNETETLYTAVDFVLGHDR